MLDTQTIMTSSGERLVVLPEAEDNRLVVTLDDLVG